MTAGQRIQKCRKTKKLSQEYVATVLGVSRQAVSKWENDLSVPDTLNYVNLAKIFGVSVEYLVFGEGDGLEEEKPPVEVPEIPSRKAEDEEREPEKSNLMLLLGASLFVIGVMVILFSIVLMESLIFYLIGILAIVLGKKMID